MKDKKTLSKIFSIILLLIITNYTIATANEDKLFDAIEEGKLSKVKLLVTTGADVNAKGINGITPLMAAVKYDNYEIVEYLFKKGADINLSDNDGRTALMHASLSGKVGMIRLLIMINNPNLNAQDLQGDTALSIAVKNKLDPCVKILLQNGADINLQDKEGNTALTIAAQNGDAETVIFLIRHGADVKTQGRRAYSLSRDKEVDKFILNHLIGEYETGGNTLENILEKGNYSQIESSLTEYMLSGLEKEQLRKLRNMYFAKYGYRFKSMDLQKYFSQFQWYFPKYSNVDDLMTESEKQFIDYIIFMEWKGGYRNLSPEYFTNTLIGLWSSWLPEEELRKRGMYSAKVTYEFDSDKSYTFVDSAEYMDGIAEYTQKGDWKLENDAIYLMAKQHRRYYIQYGAESEPEEDEAIVENPKWSEEGNLSTYLPPFKDRQMASIVLGGKRYFKEK